MGSSTCSAAVLAVGFAAAVASCGHDSFTLGPTCERGETMACYGGPPGTEGIGACKAGRRTCNDDLQDFGPCEGDVRPAAESCATPADDDCDGESNEEGGDCECKAGDERPCYTGPAGTSGTGVCTGGAQGCELGLWGACAGEVVPQKEDCANVEDDDCDGATCAGPVWAIVAGDASEQATTAIGADRQGNVFVGGTFAGSADFGGGSHASAGGTDVFLVKFSPEGELLWSRALGGPTDQALAALVVSEDGDVTIAGSSLDQGFLLDGMQIFNGGGHDVFVAKLDGESGAAKWTGSLGHSGHQRPSALAAGKDRVIVAGWFDGVLTCSGLGCTPEIESAGGDDAFVAAFDDATGKRLDVRSLGGTDNDRAAAVAVDSMGRTLVAGKLEGLAAVPLDGDTFVAVLGSDLVPLSVKVFGGTSEQEGLSLALDASGNPVLAGRAQGVVDFGNGVVAGNQGLTWWVAKLDPEGNAQWAATFSGAVADRTIQVATGSDGAVVLAGAFRGASDFGGGPLSAAPDLSDGFLVKLAPDGAFVWARQLGGRGSDDAVSATAVKANGHVLLGGAFSGAFDIGLGPMETKGKSDAVAAELEP